MNSRLIILVGALTAVPALSAGHFTSPPAPSSAEPVEIRYARIPAGAFFMGCVEADRQCDPEERPRHRVRLTRGYRLGETEVTVGQFRRFVRATGYRTAAERTGRGRRWVHEAGGWRWVEGLSWEFPLDARERAPDDYPVVQIEPRDAEAFCRWAGGRLSTEAEWERAARGGREGELYPWGDAPAPEVGGRRYANGPDVSTAEKFPKWETFAGYRDGFPALAPVKSFAPNRYGLYDIAGNVYEWTADYFDERYYERSPERDPRGPAKGEGRVVRGGGWGYHPRHLRSSFRGVFEARDFWTATVGFRCAGDVP